MQNFKWPVPNVGVQLPNNDIFTFFLIGIHSMQG